MPSPSDRPNTAAALDHLLSLAPKTLPRPSGEEAIYHPRFRPSDRLAEAFQFALQAHGAQTRKGTITPYLAHPLAVASLVMEHGGTYSGWEEEVMAALLHDTVEDCGGAPVLEEIRRRFGPEVAAIVDACTDDASGGEKAPWTDRKVAYLRHLAGAPNPVLRVSCADKLHNARAINRDLRVEGVATLNRFRAGREGTLWYYRSLADLFLALVEDGLDDVGIRSLANALAEAVDCMEGLASREAPAKPSPAPGKVQAPIKVLPWTKESLEARGEQLLKALRRQFPDEEGP